MSRLRGSGPCLVVLLLLVSCSPGPGSDEALLARVEAAIAGASDLPDAGLNLSVRDGVVTVTGSIVCEDCGGQSTPAAQGSVQQSIGAVIRAVPGVENVEFALAAPPAGPDA